MSARQDWLLARKSGIGASESAALFGLHPYISALSLYESKVRETPDEDEDENERMEDGKVIEPRIAARYAKATGRLVALPMEPLYRHKDMPHMLCSPDRITWSESVPFLPLELKWWENFRAGDEIPEYGQIQCQHQIAVLGSDAAALAVLGSFRSFHHFDIPAHWEFIDLLMEKVDTFWRKNVLERRPPDADGSDATAAALKRLFPRDNQATVFLPPESAAWAIELAQAKKDKKDAETREAEAKNKLAAAIGAATFGDVPDGPRFSYKHQHKDSYVVEAQDFRVLRRVKK